MHTTNPSNGVYELVFAGSKSVKIIDADTG